MSITKKLSPTGSEYDHSELKFTNGSDYCCVPIMRSGDSMLNECFNLIPGITVGKILIQRDEETVEKTPIFIYMKFPSDIA